MNLLYFGPAQARLFGIFHPPAPSNDAAPAAALLCPPFGHEAIRIHRFYRLLAERLARRGVAVLRFDYHGSGDSPGEDEDADLRVWAEDIREAHRELLRQSGARRITWFGARLGASLALMAARAAQPPVRRLVLWDPVFDGPAYLEALRLAHVDELEAGHCIPDPGWRRSLARDPQAFAGECLGFAIGPRLREQIAALRPDHPALLPPADTRLVADAQDAPARRWRALAEARQPAPALRAQPFRHPLIWTSNPHANNEMVPSEALQRMISEIHADP